MKRWTFAALTGLAALGVCTPAQAVTRIYSLTASNFGAGAPVDPVAATFKVTFDDTVDTANSTAGITATGLNVGLGSPLAFSYFVGSDQIYIGGLAATTIVTTSLSDDFAFYINNATTASAPTTSNFIYSSGGTFYSTFNVQVAASTATDAVPETATWAMMIIGMGAVGASVRRSRTKPKFALI